MPPQRNKPMKENLILIAVLLLIVGGAAYYVYRAKKRGDACVGCPHAKTCGSKSCSCGTKQ